MGRPIPKPPPDVFAELQSAARRVGVTFDELNAEARHATRQLNAVQYRLLAEHERRRWRQRVRMAVVLALLAGALVARALAW